MKVVDMFNSHFLRKYVEETLPPRIDNRITLSGMGWWELLVHLDTVKAANDHFSSIQLKYGRYSNTVSASDIDACIHSLNKSLPERYIMRHKAAITVAITDPYVAAIIWTVILEAENKDFHDHIRILDRPDYRYNTIGVKSDTEWREGYV